VTPNCTDSMINTLLDWLGRWVSDIIEIDCRVGTQQPALTILYITIQACLLCVPSCILELFRVSSIHDYPSVLDNAARMELSFTSHAHLNSSFEFSELYRHITVGLLRSTDTRSLTFNTGDKCS
jgi:hypothetical protein